MHTTTVMRTRISILTGLCLMAVAGCGGQSEADYIPSESAARDALSASLTAWQSGQALGPVKLGDVSIDTFDARWQAGKKLTSFEILREEPAEGPKKFVVSITLEGDAAPQEQIYLVVGNNPLLVFRQQDYDKASGMGGGG